MAALSALMFLVLGASLVGRGLWVWTRCGYDCQAVSTFGWSATLSGIVGGLLIVLGTGIALTVLAQRGR